jgi:phage-related minor tail protein
MPDFNLGTARGKIELDASGVQKGSDDASKAVGGFSSGLGQLGDTFIHKVTPIAAGVAALSVGIASSWNGAQRDIAATTGATGAQLDQYMSSVQHIAGTVKGSLGDIASVIADLAVKTHLTGAPLEALATRLLALREIGQQIAVADVAGAFTKWGVAADQWGNSLDRLFRVSQATGTPVATLLSRLADFEPILRPFGFSMEQASLVVGRLSDQALPGLRRALVGIVQNHQDAAKATLANSIAQRDYDDAVKKHGPASLEAQVAAAKLKVTQQAVTDSTGTLRESFDKLINSIKNASSDQEALSLATAAFGTKAAPALSAAIRSGKFDIDALSAAVNANKNTIVGTAAAHRSFLDELDLLKTKIAAMVGPYANTAATIATIAAGIGPLATGIKKVVDVGASFGKAIGALFKVGDAATGIAGAATATEGMAGAMGTVEAAGGAAPVVGTLAAAEGTEAAAAGTATVATGGLAAAVWALLLPVLLVIAAIGVVVGAFLLLTRVLGVDTTNAILILMATMLPFIGVPLLIINNWDKIAGFFAGLWNTVWGLFFSFFNNVVGWVEGLVGKAVELGTRFVSTIIGFFEQIPSWIIGFFERIIAAVLGFVERMIGSVAGLGVRFVATIINGIASLASSIGNVLGEAVGVVAGLPGRILGAIGDLGHLLFDAGRKVVQGFIDGVTSLIGKAIDTVTSLPGKAIGAVGNLLGIGSPSKVFRKIGEDTVAGFILGLKNSQLNLANNVADVFSIGLQPTPSIPTSITNNRSNAQQVISVDIGGIDISASFGPGTNAEEVTREFRSIAQDEIGGSLERVLTQVLTGTGTRSP